MNASNFAVSPASAIIAFVGVLISATVAYVTASRSVYVNAITASRIEWLDKIRNLIVDLRQRHLTLYLNKSAGVDSASEDVIELNRQYETLRLSLGRSAYEVNVIRLAAHCLTNANDKDKSAHFSGLLQQHARWLLSLEWRRVKLEASNILLYPWRKARLSRAELDYLWFARRDGRFDDEPTAEAELVKLEASLSPASAAPH